MGRFNDYLKNFGAVAGDHARKASDSVGGVSGAAQKAREYASSTAEGYRNVHGNMPGAKEYIQSDAGRATARHAVGHSVQTYLQNKAKKMGKAGTITGAVGNALFTFAHTAFQSHMNNLKHDQRIFENVAKARRGSPELEHLTHLELREIHEHAKRYGGPDAAHIEKTAQAQLDHRQNKKNEEQARGIEHKRGLLNEGKEARDAKRHETAKARMADKHEQRRSQKEQSHQDKMRRQAELRQTTSHVGAKATTENVAKAKAPAAGADVTKPGKKPDIVRKTKKGAVVKGEGGKTHYESNEQLAKAGKPVKRKKGPTTGMERAPGAGRGGGGRGRGGR